MTVAIDINVSVNTHQNTTKYKDLEIDIVTLWNLNNEMIPVIIGGIELIGILADFYLALIPRMPQMLGIQRIELVGTANALRKILFRKYQMIIFVYFLKYSQEQYYLRSKMYEGITPSSTSKQLSLEVSERELMPR